MIRSVIKRDSVKVASELTRHADVAHAGSRAAKSLRLLRIEGVVRAVEITCACGEVTVVELDYEQAPEKAP